MYRIRQVTHGLHHLAVAPLLLLLTSCAWNQPQSALVARGPVASVQLDVLMTTLWVILGIFIVVGGALLVAVVKFRAKPGDNEIPAQTQGNTPLELGFLAIAAGLLVLIQVPNVRALFYLENPPVEPELTVEVIGHQWWWEFRYPQYDVITANEWAIPKGRPVHLKLTTADVIHSFWAPQFAGKTDTIPNQINEMWLQADETGIFPGQCAELCGASHALMKFVTVVQDQAEFERWLEHQAAPAAQPASDAVDVQAGATKFLTAGCIACHRIKGTPAMGMIGPDLTHFGSRHTVAAGILPNTPENLSAWLKNPPAIKPGSLMPNLGLSDEDVRVLVAYLHSLK